MFEYCPVKSKVCALCAEYKEELYCGQAKSINKIKDIKKCPIKKKNKPSQHWVGQPLNI